VEINPEKITQDVKKGVQIGVEQGSQIIENVRKNGATDKPAPLTTPAGDTPTPATKQSNGGWLSIPPGLSQTTKPATDADDRLFGISLPRR
jgi:hypothetical protein